MRCLGQNPQVWATEELRDELKLMQSTTKQRVQQQITDLKEIHNAYASSNGSLVAIKGYSAYFLLGDAAVTRETGDTDVLCSDTTRLLETLSELGYTWPAHSH